MAKLEGWGTSGMVDNVRESLRKRAGKRDVERIGENEWVVAGSKSLGDSYEFYSVVKSKRWLCTCQTHPGGQYRKTCSHIVAVLLWQKDNDNPTWEGGSVKLGGDEDGERRTPSEPPSDSSPPPPPSHPHLAPDGHLSVLSGDLRDSRWGVPEIPEWVEELREHQINAIVDIVEAFENGAQVVFLDAPTGSGKTLIAECVRRIVNGGGKTNYSCTTKTLQDQFLHDYEYAKVIKGRANYQTEMEPQATCDDCTKTNPDDDCKWCVYSCPYETARNQAANSRLAVLNTSYALTVWNYGRGLFGGYPLNIIDECDMLEGALMNFAEVRVPEGTIIKYQLDYPEKKTVRETWIPWVENAILKLTYGRGHVRGEDLRAIRERKRLGRLIGELKSLRVALDDEDVNWVYMPEGKTVVFKPVTVDHIGNEVLWRHGEKWLLMSASIISAQEMADSLGLEDDWELVTVPSTFPVDNRPIHMVNVGSMGRKTKDETLPRLLEGVGKIVDDNPDHRILIHTVSYHLCKTISLHLANKGRTIIRYESSKNREYALGRFKSIPGSVLVAPSMDRGVDLPNDLCRVQVIAKTPFLFLGDKQVSTRLYGTKGGETWFNVQAIRSLVQMTGRAVRSKDDWAVTYILDGNFAQLYRKWERLFPDWWKEGLIWDGREKRRLSI